MAKPPRGHRKSPLHHDPEALRYAFANSGLSQVQFSAALNPPRSQSYISEILAGTRNANPALLRDMARVLNCPVVVLQAKLPLEATA